MNSEPTGAILTLAETAMHLRKSYSWLSRSWRRLGLQPTMLGRTLLFSRVDVEAALSRLRVRVPARRGRPRKGTFGLGASTDGQVG